MDSTDGPSKPSSDREDDWSDFDWLTVRCSRFLYYCQHLFWDVIVHSSWCLISFCNPNHPQSLLHVGYWTNATPAFQQTHMSWVGHASSGLWFFLPTVLLQRASCAPQILSLLAFCRLHPVWDVLGSCGVGGGDSQGSSLPFCYESWLIVSRTQHWEEVFTAPAHSFMSLA